MPPRRSSGKRKKSSSTSATTLVDDHEFPTPEVKMKTTLTDDLIAKETETEILIREEVSVPNRAEIDGVGFSSESMTKEEVVLANRSVVDVDETNNEDGEPDFVDVVVEEDLQLGSEDVDEGNQEVGVVTNIYQEKEDLRESENVDEDRHGEEVGKDEDRVLSIDGSQLEKIAEINSAQEEMTANDAQDFDISKSPCKNNDALVFSNGEIKGTTEIISIKKSTVKDDLKENVHDDDEESDDDSEGDDEDNKGDQDPSLIVQDSFPDTKKEKGIEIYVGKLDKNTVEDDLVRVFQQFGELKSTRIVRKPTTNKSKGFAFVRFASADQAKRALSELKDGVEVGGKRVTISASQDNDTLYLGNICKTWKKEQLLQQLKEYGIEHIETIRVPEDPKIQGKNKGFAFLEFSTHSDAVAAFQRLRKPDAVFGRDISAKVAFAQTPMHSSDEDLSQVYLEGLTEDWNEENVKEICKKYGEILKINLRPSTRNKNKDFGFVTFSSPESALACVEGINNTAIEGEAKIKASIAKPKQKSRIQKQGFRGGFKVEKQTENSNKNSNKEGESSNKNSEKPKSSKMKGVSNTQQTKINKKDSFKNKIKANTVKPEQKGSVRKDGESSKEAELSKMKGDNDSQQAIRKRKVSSEQKLNAHDQGTPKKPKSGGQGQNSQTTPKPGINKRKKASGNEAPGDRGNRNAQGKKPFKKQKGNIHGRERDNSRKPKSNNRIIRGHDDFRKSTRYIDPYGAPNYVASASNAYYVPSDHSLSTRRYKEMEPHAGYIEPATAKQSRSYSGYVQPVVRTPHSQYQTVYLEPASTSQSLSQLYSRHLDRPVITQSHRGYIETAVAPEVQPYRDYRPSAVVQIARDHYDSGLARVVRHDDRGAGVLTYVGGPPLPASQVPDRTSYYQAGGSYTNRQTYY